MNLLTVVLSPRTFGAGIQKFVKKKLGADSHMVAVIIIMVIVVALGVIFKEQLGQIADSLFAKINAFMSDL